jgi:hypothetical protein
VVVANGEGQNHNEIKAYLEGRYVSASEASWRLFSFKMHEGTPSITRLALHELGMHKVMYNDNASIFETINSEQNQKTCSLNTSKPILITPWPEKSRTWIFPLCLHGPMGRKNGPSGREGVVSGAFISLVLPLANVISCVHC